MPEMAPSKKGSKKSRANSRIGWGSMSNCVSLGARMCSFSLLNQSEYTSQGMPAENPPSQNAFALLSLKGKVRNRLTGTIKYQGSQKGRKLFRSRVATK